MIRHLRRQAMHGARLVASILMLSVLALPVAAAPPVPQFHAADTYLIPGVGEGFHESGTASADFNNDGYPDIAVVNWFQIVGRVFVLLNRGDGTFGGNPVETLWNYRSSDLIGVGPLPGTVLTADLNHDGNADLVTASHFLVTVFLGKGDGSFTKSDQFFQILHAGQLDGSLADVNRDGKIDLLVQATLGIQTFLGNGDGTFKRSLFPIYTSVSYTNPPLPPIPVFTMSGFDLVNLNNDGIPDMLVSDAFISRSVYSLLGRGDGTFRQIDKFRSGFAPGGTLGGDFNEDGIDDAVVINEFNILPEIQGKSGDSRLTDGTGHFVGSGVRFDCGGIPIAFALVDINHDGHLDTVCSDVFSLQDFSLGQIAIGLGDGQGNFYPGGKLPIYFFPQTPVVADFNRDGKLDIAAPGTIGVSTVHVALQK